jgi:hypothetical protein
MVDMPREDNIHLLIFQNVQEVRRPPDNRVDRRSFHIYQRMVTNKDPYLLVIGVTELIVHELQLALRNHAIRPVPVRQDRASRVDTDNKTVFVLMNDILHRCDKIAVTFHRIK